jgi:Peptidase family M1 domain
MSRFAASPLLGRLSSSLVGALLTILLLPIPTGLAQQAQARGLPSYTLNASLDWDNARLTVDQTTRFRNRTGQTLDRAVFQVPPAYFGAFTLRGATTQGQTATATLNGSVLDLPLPAPLASDASTDIGLSFTIDVPRSPGRFSAGPRYIALGNWYPTLSVHRGDWDRHQFTDVGDSFVTEVSNFQVNLTSTVPVVLASSGRQLEGDGMSFRLEALGVRDFGLTLSPSYLVAESQAGSTTVRAYTFSADRGRQYVATAANFLRWYGQHFGAYPYRTFSLAEVDLPASYGGMEYPGLIFVSSALQIQDPFEGSPTDVLLGHEIAHQWFYSVVGDDQVQDPWLDEAFASYLPYYYYRSTIPDQFDRMFSTRVLARVASNLPVDASIDSFASDPPYYGIVYNQGAAFLEELRSTVGDNAFEAAIREIVSTFADKIASPRAVLDIFQRNTSANLNPLIGRYFSYAAFKDPSPVDLRLDTTTSPWRGSASLSITAEFVVANVEVWLDNRRIYSGPQNNLTLDLHGIDPGDYALLVRLLDARGVQYERARRVTLD